MDIINGATAQWHNGTMAQWRNGTMAQWHNGVKIYSPFEGGRGDVNDQGKVIR